MTEDSVLVIEGADSLLDDDGKPRRTGSIRFLIQIFYLQFPFYVQILVLN